MKVRAILTLAVTAILLMSNTINVSADVDDRFSDNNDGTISDSITGLMWQKVDEGIEVIWMDALAYCEALTVGGYTDWRLPNIKELYSIVAIDRHDPAIDTTHFPNTSSAGYWSSTPETTCSARFFVQFDKGRADREQYYSTAVYHARCVR